MNITLVQCMQFAFTVFYIDTVLSLSQVHSLSSFLEMEGYDRPPFTTNQLESFHCLVTQRLEQEKETVSQVLVRKSLYNILFDRRNIPFGPFNSTRTDSVLIQQQLCY